MEATCEWEKLKGKNEIITGSFSSILLVENNFELEPLFVCL
jgi:hypothetical protein